MTAQSLSFLPIRQQEKTLSYAPAEEFSPGKTTGNVPHVLRGEMLLFEAVLRRASLDISSIQPCPGRFILQPHTQATGH